MVRLARFFSAAALLAGLIAACSTSERVMPIADSDPLGGAGGTGGKAGSGGSAPDSGIILEAGDFFDANCGFQAIDARREPGRVYFVVDRSGSMTDSVGSLNKYSSVRNALVKLVERIGWRSEIGATIFPGKGTGSCTPGEEVFPMQPGDNKQFFDEGTMGPIASKFAQSLQVQPKGGTPTGKTLAALVPKLTGLGPNTYVLLATDGGPNCNDEVQCEAKGCIPNIEKQTGCTDSLNCCDPKIDPQFSSANCLDSNTTLAAVVALAQAGIKTIVVGIPGSTEYANLLDLLAVAGGAPREGDTRYYRVDDLSTLEELLLKIGSEVTVSCDLTLDAPPTDPNEINIFFDKKLVLQDSENGWQWLGPTSIGLRGKACDDLLSGAVDAVQVVEGCPTEVLK